MSCKHLQKNGKCGLSAKAPGQEPCDYIVKTRCPLNKTMDKEYAKEAERIQKT